MSLKMEELDTAYEQQDDDKTKKEDKTPFWINNPNVILHKDHLFEFFPTEDMSFNQKLNALTRTVLFMTLLSFAYTHNVYILFVGVVSIGFIYLMHAYKEKIQEPFDLSPPVDDLLDIPDNAAVVFQDPTASNPFSNVLVSHDQFMLDI